MFREHLPILQGVATKFYSVFLCLTQGCTGGKKKTDAWMKPLKHLENAPKSAVPFSNSHPAFLLKAAQKVTSVSNFLAAL